MIEKVRLASIGLGRWARVLARAALRGDVIELHSCFSRSEEKQAALREEFGVPKSAATLDELLADDEIEGVIITTPNDIHRDLIFEALEAGKAVHTDQPITHILEDAGDVPTAVHDTGGGFAVGHSARRLSGSRVMKRWIEDGSLGEVMVQLSQDGPELRIRFEEVDRVWLKDVGGGHSTSCILHTSQSAGGS